MAKYSNYNTPASQNFPSHKGEADYYYYDLGSASSPNYVGNDVIKNFEPGLDQVVFTQTDSKPSGFIDYYDAPESGSIDVATVSGSPPVQTVKSIGRITYVQAPILSIDSGNINDIDGLALDYISISQSNKHFGGQTRLGGSLKVSGDAADTLSDVYLEIKSRTGSIAKAVLSESGKYLLGKSLGSGAGSLTTSSVSDLFELSNSEAAKIDVKSDGNVDLTLVAISSSGEKATKTLPTLKILTTYNGSNLYSKESDEIQGGDNWALPSTIELANHYASKIKVNDFSNMNGGNFYGGRLYKPHASHKEGTDFDGIYDGYIARDAKSADIMMDLLNDTQFGSRIFMVGVTYKQIAGNSFYDEIKGKRLNDGRLATNVIRPWENHEDHFHWRMVTDSKNKKNLTAQASDFDGNGTKDLLWRNRSGYINTWNIASNSGVIEDGNYKLELSSAPNIGSIDGNWKVQSTGDMNGDGVSDILWRDTLGHVNSWLIGLDGAVMAAPNIGTVGNEWAVQSTGDLNGDGAADILWRDTAGHINAWFMGSDGNVSSAPNIGAVSSDWTVKGVADFNGDGISDILWQDTAGHVNEWLMGSNGEVTSAPNVGVISPE